ncbi:MAG: Spy/CpxP family protein refolding chaperone [Phycisphaeraceae bacterium]|nr:Spy/CpxP family protein refolding chaperone [Phycisphaeraceae bacterium]
MKSSHLLALTTAALFATGSAFAGPNCKKNCPKDGASDEGVYEVIAEGEDKGNCKKGKCDGKKREGSEEGVYEVAERDDDAKEGKRGERGERGDRKRHNPLRGLDLSDEQKEEVQAIMEASREEAKAIMEEAKASKEAGEEVDRKAVREQMMEVRKGAMDNVYENVLSDEQRAKVDERRKAMEERRAAREKNREGKDGERPERPRRDKGDDELDL